MDYSLVILTHNAEAILPALTASITALTTQPAEIIIVDSASSDDTVQSIKKLLPTATVLAQPRNVDFCRGYNIGIAHAKKSDYVLMINQRITMQPDSATQLLNKITSDKTLAAVGPKLLNAENKKIDSMGIVSDRRRQFDNLGEGEEDTGQHDDTKVFGVSGAAIMLRMEAVQDITKNGGGRDTEFLDHDFIAYKDDVDIAYRFRHRGWSLAVEPSAVMYYDRNTGDGKKRASRSKRAKTYSLRNHWWVLLKNEPFSAIVRDLIWVATYESMKLTYLTLRDPRTVLSVVPAYFRALPRMLKKRGAILKSSTHADSLKQWFQ